MFWVSTMWVNMKKVKLKKKSCRCTLGTMYIQGMKSENLPWGGEVGSSRVCEQTAAGAHTKESGVSLEKSYDGKETTRCL